MASKNGCIPLGSGLQRGPVHRLIIFWFGFTADKGMLFVLSLFQSGYAHFLIIPDRV